VLRSMAGGAQGDEVLCRVVSQPAAKCSVMDLEVSKRPAQLTTPSVSLYDLLAESSVVFGVESPTGFTLAQHAHPVFSGFSIARTAAILTALNSPDLAWQGILPIVLLQTSSCHKIGTDHLQAIAAGFVRS